MSTSRSLLLWTLRFRSDELPRRTLALWLAHLEEYSEQQIEVALGSLKGSRFLPKLGEAVAALDRARADDLLAGSVLPSCQVCSRGLVSLRGPDGYAVVSACSCESGRRQGLSSPPLDDLLARGFTLERVEIRKVDPRAPEPAHAPA